MAEEKGSRDQKYEIIKSLMPGGNKKDTHT